MYFKLSIGITDHSGPQGGELDVVMEGGSPHYSVPAPPQRQIEGNAGDHLGNFSELKSLKAQETR